MAYVWTVVNDELKVLHYPYWDDLEFSVNSVRQNPATSKPDYDYTNVGWLFDDSSTETVVGSRQMEHTWATGTDIYPHVHWTQTASGVVKWQLEYKILDNGQASPGSWTTITTTDVAFTYTSGSLEQISPFAAVSVSAGISFVFKVRVSRLGGDAADTMVGDVLFNSFDCHFRRNTPGSNLEYTK